MTKTKKPTKAFDVHKPGKSAPAASGRSTIVNNHPLARDPMMREDAKVDVEPSDEQPKEEVKPHVELKLEPLHADIATAEDEKPATPEEVAAESSGDAKTDALPDADLASDEPEADQADDGGDVVIVKTKADEPNVPEEEIQPSTPEPEIPDESEKTSDDSKSASSDTEEDATQEEDREAAEQADKLRQLAASHKYYLPINQVRKRHARAATLWILLAVVVVLIIIDLALDANLFTIAGIKPVTDFLN